MITVKKERLRHRRRDVTATPNNSAADLPEARKVQLVRLILPGGEELTVEYPELPPEEQIQTS